MILGWFTILFLSHVSALTFPFVKNNNDRAQTIQVCQNKDCCKRWSLTYQRLPQTLRDLLPPGSADLVQVETTGCLGQCGKGPNLCLKKRGSKEVYLNGISGAMTLADELEAHLGIQVPSKLVAAVTVMEKAHNAPEAEKDLFYSSVIKVLSSDPVLGASSANARAIVYRAQARHDAGRWEDALEDAQAALQVVNNATFSTEVSSAIAAAAWRTTADCYKSQGNVKQAMEALRQLARANTTFQSKIDNEIESLLESTTNDPVG